MKNFLLLTLSAFLMCMTALVFFGSDHNPNPNTDVTASYSVETPDCLAADFTFNALPETGIRISEKFPFNSAGENLPISVNTGTFSYYVFLAEPKEDYKALSNWHTNLARLKYKHASLHNSYNATGARDKLTCNLIKS